MDYVMLGALGLGVLLFVLGWLRMAVAGFQRHPLTGLLALVPGVNLLTLPSLWHRVGGWVISGLVGVMLAAGTWFAGAGDVLARYLSANDTAVATSTAPDTTPVTPAPQPAETGTQTVALDLKQPTAASAPAVAAPAPAAAPAVTPAIPQITQDLPKAALYRVTFSELAVEKLPEQVGQYVRITQKDGRSREGKLLSSATGSLELEERQGGNRVTRTLNLSDIRTAALLTSQGGE